MSIGFWQIAVVVILVVLLFGRGKISSLMGDVAKGIKSFKKGMSSDPIEDDTPKNISENQDSTNQDSTNQDSNKQESNNKD
jgi:sec-independent protein translocase protein TatA